MKHKSKVKKLIQVAILYTCFALVCGLILDLIILKVYMFVKNPVKMYETVQVLVPKKPKVLNLTKSTEIREYVFNEVKKAGLDPFIVDCLHDHEADYNPNAWNVNKNGSIDVGIWQINSVHTKSGKISLFCASDVICSTKWAIEKRKHDGNWDAWVGYKKHCK